MCVCLAATHEFLGIFRSFYQIVTLWNNKIEKIEKHYLIKFSMEEKFIDFKSVCKFMNVLYFQKYFI